MSYWSCSDADAKACLNQLIKNVNDDLTVTCQIPFSLPKKQVTLLIDRAKKWFYKNYEDAVEETYLGFPSTTFSSTDFTSGSTRGTILLPEGIIQVFGVFQTNKWSGEAGGWGGNNLNGNDSDFSIQKIMYGSLYNNSNGAGISSDSLMFYVINQMYIDNARQVLSHPMSYTYNRLNRKFRFQGQLPTNSVILQVSSKIDDCALFSDELFERYIIATAKVQLSRILGTFNYNLPGNISINFDLIREEGRDELDKILEEIKTDEGVDYFFSN